MGITTRILRSCRPLGPCAGEPMASSVPQRLSSRRSFRSALANSNTNPEAALKLEQLVTIEPFYDRREFVMKSASVPSARGRVAEQPIGGRM
jgi:hypothetical protein